jgi:uncharacterized protein YjbI with pentapeptide repeats
MPELSHFPFRKNYFVLALLLVLALDPITTNAQISTQQLMARQPVSTSDVARVFVDHQKWLSSHGSEGQRASLENRDLRNIKWSEVEIAVVVGASVSMNNRKVLSLDRAEFYNADLSGSVLHELDFPYSLRGASFVGADFHSAWLFGISFARAILEDANLTDTTLAGCDLSNASLRNADLTRTTFEQCKMTNVVYEPKPGSIPNLYSFNLQQLSELRYKQSALGLLQLRNEFAKNGQRDEERILTYTIERTRTVHSWKDGRWAEAGFRFVLFDLPCAWGLHPDRCLKCVLGSVWFFSFPYFASILLRKRATRSGIWAVRLSDPVHAAKAGTRALRVELDWPRTGGVWAKLRAILRAMRTALYFSFLSAFRVGFRDFDIGSWITRVQSREYTLRATGWVRVIAGIQSVLSVYFVALWILTYFGRPFE